MYTLDASTIYKCRSYNQGNVVIVDLNKSFMTFKDRFGNELDILDNINAVIANLEANLDTSEIILTRPDEMVFKITESSDSTTGETKLDNSFLCFRFF